MDYQEFDSLKLEDQAKIIQQSTIREKGELLMRCHEPAAIVRNLPEEEFYLITKEMDPEERSEIIRFASLPQLFFISDIECWKKDRIDPKGFIRWLETLQLADDNKLFHWLMEGDYEGILAGFMKVISVLKIDREQAMDELLGDTPYFTLDDNYYITVNEEDLQTVRKVFEVLFENHRGRYVALLEGILSELEDQTEEEAFLMRDRRLSERGFPDLESAFKIYRSISKKEFDEFPRKTAPKEESGVYHSFLTPAPGYLTLWSKDKLFLDEALEIVAAKDMLLFDSLKEEMAWISNKIIACHGIDFSSEEKIRQGVERARRILSLGLELLSEGDLKKAARFLAEHWLETIFRWGATGLNQLRDESKLLVKKYWQGRPDQCLLWLNPPYEHIFRGLLKLIPEVYEFESALSQDIQYRNFTTPEDLKRSNLALEQIQLIHEVLANYDGTIFSRFFKQLEESIFSPTLFSALSQLFALFLLQGKLVPYRPVTSKECLKFLDKGFQIKNQKRVLDVELKESFLNQLFTPNQKQSLIPLWSLFFCSLVEEFEGVGVDQKVDPRFIESLEVSK